MGENDNVEFGADEVLVSVSLDAGCSVYCLGQEALTTSKLTSCKKKL